MQARQSEAEAEETLGNLSVSQHISGVCEMVPVSRILYSIDIAGRNYMRTRTALVIHPSQVPQAVPSASQAELCQPAGAG